jgi:hypothetical protein
LSCGACTNVAVHLASGISGRCSLQWWSDRVNAVLYVVAGALAVPRPAAVAHASAELLDGITAVLVRLLPRARSTNLLDHAHSFSQSSLNYLSIQLLRLAAQSHYSLTTCCSSLQQPGSYGIQRVLAQDRQQHRPRCAPLHAPSPATFRTSRRRRISASGMAQSVRAYENPASVNQQRAHAILVCHSTCVFAFLCGTALCALVPVALHIQYPRGARPGHLAQNGSARCLALQNSYGAPINHHHLFCLVSKSVLRDLL